MNTARCVQHDTYQVECTGLVATKHDNGSMGFELCWVDYLLTSLHDMVIDNPESNTYELVYEYHSSGKIVWRHCMIW